MSQIDVIVMCGVALRIGHNDKKWHKGSTHFGWTAKINVCKANVLLVMWKYEYSIFTIHTDHWRERKTAQSTLLGVMKVKRPKWKWNLNMKTAEVFQLNLSRIHLGRIFNVTEWWRWRNFTEGLLKERRGVLCKGTLWCLPTTVPLRSPHKQQGCGEITITANHWGNLCCLLQIPHWYIALKNVPSRGALLVSMPY